MPPAETAGAAGAALGSVASTASGATAATAAGVGTAAGMTAGATLSAGAGVLAGTYGTTAAIVGGAAGAFAGSVASQGVGSAMGATSFSWRNVAASTVAGAVTAGFGAATSGAASLANPVVRAMATGAVGNLSNYAANKLAGNDVGFSWRSVAASVVSAAITAEIVPALGTAFQIDPNSMPGDLLAGITGGVVSAHVRQGLVGGGVDYQAVFVDAFGNVLAGAWAQPARQQEVAGNAVGDLRYALASVEGGGSSGLGASLDENGIVTLDTVTVRPGSDLTGERDVQVLRAAILDNIRADRRRSNAINVGAFNNNAIAVTPRQNRVVPTSQPYQPAPVQPESIPLPEPIAPMQDGWQIAGAFAEGVGGAVAGVGREVVDTPLRIWDMGVALSAVTVNLFRDEGDYLLPEMVSGMSRDYARSGQDWDQFALDHNPLYAGTVGLGTAIGNAAGAAVADGNYLPLANLGGEVAGGVLVGKAMGRYGDYGVTFADIGAKGIGRSQAGSVGLQFGRVANSGVGIPATRSPNPLSPVLEFDKHGNEIFHRTMSPSDFAKLQRTGKLPATAETFISPSEAYSRGYDGVLVRMTTKPGTSQQLLDVGVTANPGTANLFPGMPTAAKGWTASNAMFKVEGNVVNMGLGRGSALGIFNQNIVLFEPIY